MRRGKRVIGWLAVAAVVAAGSGSPAVARSAGPKCYLQNGTQVCVTVATPTPVPTPTPRVVVRTVVRTVVKRVVQRVPVVHTVVKTKTIVKRIPVYHTRVVRVTATPRRVEHNEALPYGYPPGGKRLPNGYYAYRADGRALVVGCNPEALCMFALPDGERITAKAIQDSVRWDSPDTTYGPDHRSVVVVKVKGSQAYAMPGQRAEDLRTQLIVFTDKSLWPYTISLYSSPAAPLNGTRIAFFHPEPKATPHPIVQAIPTLPPTIAPCVLHEPTGFILRGTATFMPTDVFTDGAGHTCIQMPKSMQAAPLVYRGRDDETINYRFRDDGMIVVDGTPDVLILQLGTGKGSTRLYVLKDLKTVKGNKAK